MIRPSAPVLLLPLRPPPARGSDERAPANSATRQSMKECRSNVHYASVGNHDRRASSDGHGLACRRGTQARRQTRGSGHAGARNGSRAGAAATDRRANCRANATARGGLTAWKAVQTMSWKGKMGAGGTTYMSVSPKGKLQQKEREEMQLPYRLEFKRPLKSRLELDFNGQTAVQVYDGVKGWKRRPYLGRDEWEAYTADELQQAAAEPGIDGYLIDHASKGAKVQLAGTDKVEGHAAYKLKVTRKDGQVRQVWVDGQSFLELRVDGAPRRLDGKVRAVAVYL